MLQQFAEPVPKTVQVFNFNEELFMGIP